jgi:hypothetical protein
MSQKSTDMEKLSTTKCPKMGTEQWSCSKDECICHLKEKITCDYPNCEKKGTSFDMGNNGKPFVCCKW